MSVSSLHDRGPVAGYLAAVLSLAACIPAAGAAQAPGGWQPNPRTLQAEYFAEVLNGVNKVAVEWSRAWSNDRLDDLVELYAEDAVLIPVGEVPLRGRREIRRYLAQALKPMGRMEAFMLDFDASGEMAMVYGNYRTQVMSGADAGVESRGPMVTVYLREGRAWRIRSQVFRR